MIVCSKREEFDYVMEADRGQPEERQTVFRCRPLTLGEVVEIEDLVGTNMGQGGFPAGTVHCRVIKMGLVGWRNLQDDNGVDISFQKTQDEGFDKLLERFTTAQRTELSDAIWEGSNLKAEDIKN